MEGNEKTKVKGWHKIDTWERRVFYSIPVRYLQRAKEELCKEAGISNFTFRRYLQGKYPNPVMRDWFRSVLFETYKRYSEMAAEDVLVQLD